MRKWDERHGGWEPAGPDSVTPPPHSATDPGSPVLEVGLSGKIQDAQLYLNFRETTNNFFIISVPQISHEVYL